jgi:PAS domain S-box-containing protein
VTRALVCQRFEIDRVVVATQNNPGASRRMKILSLTYEYPPIGGGGGVVAAALNEALVAAGHEVTVVTSAMRGLDSREMVRGVTVYRVPCIRRYRHYSTVWELATTLIPAYRRAAQLIREQRPDLLHVHFVYPSGVLAYLLARRFKIPFVLTAHGSDIPGYNPDRFEILHNLLKPLWRKIVRGAAAVTSPSRFLAGLIQRQLPRDVEIVPNGYAPTNQPPLPKRNLVLVVARLFPRKGVQHFINSVSTFGDDWEFVIAGDGPYMPVLKAQASRVRCPARFVGFVDKGTLHDLYQQARIFVFPSIRENFPVVLLEAMDAGCAVITTDADGCAEVVGDAGIVIQAGSASQIRDALTDLMAAPQRCEELSRRARERVDLFRWPRIAGMYRDVFAAATQQAPAAAPAVQKDALPAMAAPGARPVPLEHGRHIGHTELLEYTHDAIIIWEMGGEGILYWNRAAERLYGYNRQDAHGKTTHTLLNTQLTGGVSLLEDTVARFGVWMGELQHTTRAGTTVVVESRLALLSQQNGRWLVLEVNRDITDQKAAEAARLAMEQQLAELKALRNPPRTTEG